jgi:hypothetical protein
LKKICLDPSYVPVRFFAAARGRACAIDKKYVCLSVSVITLWSCDSRREGGASITPNGQPIRAQAYSKVRGKNLTYLFLRSVKSLLIIRFSKIFC